MSDQTSHQNPYPNSWIPKPFIAFALLALVSLVLAGCDNSQAREEAKPDRPVLTIKVRYEPQTPDRSFVGTIRPRIESDVGFRVAGKVARRIVEVGQVVEAGEPLALLDEADLKLQAEQAEAEFKAASGVLVQAAASERRATELKAKGWTTDVQLDQARAAADEARGRVTRAQRSVELTKNNLSYATLTADARGVVTSTSAEPGQVVAAGQGVVRIARIAEKEVVVAVPETLVARAESGKAQVSLWSDPDKTYAAKLRELAPAADPVSRTYLAKFSIPDAGDDVKLGMTATLSLAEPATERIARVPLSAIYNQGTGAAVFVADEKTGRIELKPVEVKVYETRDALIAGGVRDGESVIALGVHKLDTAQKVRVVSQLSF
jgi:RND family efflux transporter MFP subunit